MFLEGIARVDKVISENDRILIKDSILNAYNENRLNLEDDSFHYNNSFGIASMPIVDEFYDKLTPIVESITNLKLKKENSYSRIYNKDSKLTPHRDRDGLDITVSIQIENTTGFKQPIFCETYWNETMEASLDNGDMVIIRGRDLLHWRNKIDSVEGGFLICCFYHWRIVDNDIKIINGFLDKNICQNIILDAEIEGLNKSQVIKEGTEVHDDYSRSSSTLFLKDKYGLSDLLIRAIPQVSLLNIEGWQLVRYNKSEEFKEHFDCLNREKDRLITCLIYLNDDFEGGETFFVNKNKSIIPNTGRLVVWKNISNGTCDSMSLHAGNPVTSGVKYILVTWINLLK